MYEELWTIVAASLETVPGETYDEKIEIISNVLGIAGFVTSLALVFISPLFRIGGRRPATQADLERLSRAVVDMIGDRVADQLSGAALASSVSTPAFIDGQNLATREQVRRDLVAAIQAITADDSPEALSAAAALIHGDTGSAERLLARKAANARSRDAERSAEALHLQAALQATHDPEGALEHCEEAVRTAPGSAAGWNRLGHLYLRLGNARKARHAFERAQQFEAAARDATHPARLDQGSSDRHHL